jgi:hypothetical protein
MIAVGVWLLNYRTTSTAVEVRFTTPIGDDVSIETINYMDFDTVYEGRNKIQIVSYYEIENVWQLLMKK